MADRYQSDDRLRRERSQRGSGRQAEQFQSDYDDQRRSQMGESWRDDDGRGWQQSGWESDDRFERERGGGRDYRSAQSERYGSGSYGPARSGGGRGFASFTGNDYGGGDFSGGIGSSGQQRGSRGGYSGTSSYGAGSWLGKNHGEWRDRSSGREHHGRGSGDERGFFERAGDEVASWFGDEDATRRREQDHRGRGPVGYTRTDDRIREDASERLTEDWAVDARKIELAVSKGEITLTGTVATRDQKRRAEDLVEDLSGVKHVQNNLRVDDGSTWDSTATTTGTGKTTS
jgi:osmotically-inducible protein OsmY